MSEPIGPRARALLAVQDGDVWNPDVRMAVAELVAHCVAMEAALCAVWNDVAGDVGGESHVISAGALYRVRKALDISNGGVFATPIKEDPVTPR